MTTLRPRWIVATISFVLAGSGNALAAEPLRTTGCAPISPCIALRPPADLRRFDSCTKGGPPRYYNFCCHGLPDCSPRDCCGCDNWNPPGWQPDGTFHRTSGFDCDTGLIEPRVTFRGIVTRAYWFDPNDDDWDRDLTFDVFPDEGFEHMLVNDSVNPGVGEGIHGEVPYDWLPESLHPLRGDHVDLFGDWVEDCDHVPKKTEIHPVYGMSISRLHDCHGRKAMLGMVFYLGYGPRGSEGVSFRVEAPPDGGSGQMLRFQEIPVITEVIDKTVVVHREAPHPHIEVNLKTPSHPGKPLGRCVSDDPSKKGSIRKLRPHYHAVFSLWWE